MNTEKEYDDRDSFEDDGSEPIEPESLPREIGPRKPPDVVRISSVLDNICPPGRLPHRESDGAAEITCPAVFCALLRHARG